jgi:UTP-glucose-1-phosphate uridylyltransferase
MCEICVGDDDFAVLLPDVLVKENSTENDLHE